MDGCVRANGDIWTVGSVQCATEHGGQLGAVADVEAGEDVAGVILHRSGERNSLSAISELVRPWAISKAICWFLGVSSASSARVSELA